MFSRSDYTVFSAPEKNSFLTKTETEWDTADTDLVSGTPASWMANHLLHNGEKKPERARGD